jgi:hypothetical protein
MVDDLIPTTTIIYGWLSIPESLPEGSAYWLLVSDKFMRLVWVAERGIQHDSNVLNMNNQIDPTTLSPLSVYQDNDLKAILGYSS